jgi:hypothetical protein
MLVPLVQEWLLPFSKRKIFGMQESLLLRLYFWVNLQIILLIYLKKGVV